MDQSQRIFARLRLENMILKADGSAFQSLFADIMEMKHGGRFERVRPYGNKGDLKCDGYLPSSKTVFQCYGPRTLSESNMKKKVNEDFYGAVKHWESKMAQWRFVHNDFDGLPPGVTQLLEELRGEFPHIDISSLPPSEFLDLAMEVSPQKLEALIGQIPSMATIQSLTFHALRPVILHLARQEPPANPPLTAPSPSKLEVNDLSHATAGYLRLGRRQESLVQEFFDTYPEPDFGEHIAEGFRQKYIMLKGLSLSGDEIFRELQCFAGGGDRGVPLHEAAVMAVLSYFFERCDIFEDTPSHKGGAVA